MRFEENSNCTLAERIKLVSQEILDAYPMISLAKAKVIAMHDEPINANVTNDMKFIRYYYMMLFLNNDLNIRYEIYRVMENLCIEGLKDEKLLMVMNEIDNFMLGNREDFPMISEVYI